MRSSGHSSKLPYVSRGAPQTSRRSIAMSALPTANAPGTLRPDPTLWPVTMSIAIREHVVVDANRSVSVSNARLEPGMEAEVIVLVEDRTGAGSAYSFFDTARQLGIDAPEDYSIRFEDDKRL